MSEMREDTLLGSFGWDGEEERSVGLDEREMM